MSYLYPLSLLVISLAVALLERLYPLRPQRQLRPAIGSDLAHLVFNGHFLGVLLAGIAAAHILPPLDRLLGQHGLVTFVYRNQAAALSLWVQIPVVLLGVDLLQYGVHNLLHRVPFLWTFHQVHHSVVDGEMDWIVSFRFQWAEVVVYKSLLYLPLSFFGFAPLALLVHAIFGTLIGHLNHANLNLGHGAWRYVLNNPRMHIWHHDYAGGTKTTVNFGIIFSCWDYLFGTARVPDQPPPRLGFPGVEAFPTGFLGHTSWPLPRWLGAGRVRGAVAGAALLALAYLLSRPPQRPQTPMLGETAATSQPAALTAEELVYAETPAQAEAALSRFGTEAKAAGYAHPEALVSVPELAAALSSPRLALLDLRPMERFLIGHIPSAQPIDRDDLVAPGPVPGLLRPREEILSVLRARGVGRGAVIVIYSDGGPEAFRLFWALRELVGLSVRVLDGGLGRWKAAGHAVARGAPLRVAVTDLPLPAAPPAPALLYHDIAPILARSGALLLDNRSAGEYSGKLRHPEAARSGRIPGARHLPWQAVLRDDGRLLPPAELAALFERHGAHAGTHVVTSCQSGNRSAAVYFALFVMGHDRALLTNYIGSFAEYSRLDLPVEQD